MALGAVAGLVAVVLVAADYAPALTPEMIKLLFFKGLGAVAVGLIVVGSLLGRFGREGEKRLELEARLNQPSPKASLNAPPVISELSDSKPDTNQLAGVRERSGATESDR